jgi:hypothetical protein
VQLLQGYVQTPFGKWQMVGQISPAPSAVASVTIPPQLWSLLWQYGSKALPVILADLPALANGTKTVQQVIADVFASLAA